MRPGNNPDSQCASPFLFLKATHPQAHTSIRPQIDDLPRCQRPSPWPAFSPARLLTLRLAATQTADPTPPRRPDPISKSPAPPTFPTVLETVPPISAPPTIPRP